jgi:serine/threonine-protein kinase
MTQAPPPLSREIPAGVAQVVLQSLQKDPRARYTSAAEMARSAREGRVVTGGIPVSPLTPPDGQTQYFGSDQTALIGAGVGGGNTAEHPTGQMAQQDDKKSSATPWIITAAVVAVMALIGLLIWLDQNQNDPGDFEDNSPSASPSASPSQEPTTSEEPSTEDDDDDSDYQPTTEEETSETPDEETSTPGEETSTPGEETSTPDTETSTPGDESTPPDDTATPSENATNDPE